MNRVQFLRNLIAQHRQIGISPCELHMNSTTADDFSRDVDENTPDNRSVLDKMRHPKREMKRLETFEGLKIVTNDTLEGSAIIVRPLQTMGDPDWLDYVQRGRPSAPAQSNGAREALQQRHDSEPADLQRQDDILSQLTRNAGISPSTVLIKAMEDLDKVEDVIVLRFYRGGSIDMASTMPRFGVIGALQASLGHIANGGE
jgi:hypothetical protein